MLNNGEIRFILRRNVIEYRDIWPVALGMIEAITTMDKDDTAAQMAAIVDTLKEAHILGDEIETFAE